MQPFRFVHAADLHIDSPVKGLKARNDVVGKRVQEAGYQALDNLVRLCLTEKVDFLLVAGDVYDGAIRSPQAQLRFRDALDRLWQAGIQSFVVHGNHDPLDGRFSSITWPAGVHIFGADPEWATALRDGEPIARIQGISYPKRDVTENLAARFLQPLGDGMFSIGLLHCNLGGDPAHPNYAPCTMADLQAHEINYWALGHIHKKSVVRGQFTTVVYPGNIQGRDAGEQGERGCYLVDVSASGVELEFRALDTVRWVVQEVPVDGMEGIDALRDAILSALDAARDEAAGRDVVCRVGLTGRGPVHRDLAVPSDVEELLELIRGSLPMTPPWIWVERIANETRPEIDLEARAGQDDFLGEVLRRAGGTRPEEFREALGELFSGRRESLPELSDGEVGDLIEEARWYLADLLESSETGEQREVGA